MDGLLLSPLLATPTRTAHRRKEIHSGRHDLLQNIQADVEEAQIVHIFIFNVN